MVVLYTDGVTEARLGDAFFGEAGMAGVLAASAGLTAQAVADAIVAAALTFQHGRARDGMAVVVVRKPLLARPDSAHPGYSHQDVWDERKRLGDL